MGTITGETLKDTYVMLLNGYPNEVAFCWLGRVITEPDSAKRVEVTSVVKADHVIRSDESHVFFAGEPCLVKHALGIGHDHPYAVDRACEHSDDDVNMLNESKHALFSVVLCGSGQAEILWQDGRRMHFTWAMVKGDST